MGVKLPADSVHGEHAKPGESVSTWPDFRWDDAAARGSAPTDAALSHETARAYVAEGKKRVQLSLINLTVCIGLVRAVILDILISRVLCDFHAHLKTYRKKCPARV